MTTLIILLLLVILAAALWLWRLAVYIRNPESTHCDCFGCKAQLRLKRNPLPKNFRLPRR